MTDATDTTATEAGLRRLTQRVAAIETILVLVPMLLAELCLVFSLFTLFFTTNYYDDELFVSFLTLPFQAFAPSDEGEASVANVALGVTSLVLLALIVASMIAVGAIGLGGLSERADGICTLIVGLLFLGTLALWFVAATGINASDRWILGPGLPLLTAAAVIAGLVAFLPAYRSLWSR